MISRALIRTSSGHYRSARPLPSHLTFTANRCRAHARPTTCVRVRIRLDPSSTRAGD